MSSPWSDLDRPPLSQPRLARTLAAPWRTLEVRTQTASTNADVAAALRDGSGDGGVGLVVVAEHQSAGRGRLGRTWEAPARSAVLLSAGIAPPVPVESWSLLPLLTGVAVAEALQAVSRLLVELKWPNDLLAGGRKLGGILVERVDRPAAGSSRPAAVVGVGVNVSVRAAELPVPDATSVAVEGGVTDREPLVAEIVRTLGRRLAAWVDAGGDARAVLPAYRAICATMGSEVTVRLPGDEVVTGRAVDVDDTGRLVVVSGDGARRAFSAGDVTHVRPAGGR